MNSSLKELLGNALAVPGLSEPRTSFPEIQHFDWRWPKLQRENDTEAATHVDQTVHTAGLPSIAPDYNDDSRKDPNSRTKPHHTFLPLQKSNIRDKKGELLCASLEILSHASQSVCQYCQHNGRRARSVVKSNDTDRMMSDTREVLEMVKFTNICTLYIHVFRYIWDSSEVLKYLMPIWFWWKLL